LSCNNLLEGAFVVEQLAKKDDIRLSKYYLLESLLLSYSVLLFFFITMITPYGVVENEHYIGLVDQQLVMDDLF